MIDPPKTLDVDDLLANRLPISPPLWVTIGTRKRQVAFVLLSTETVASLEALAEAHIHEENMQLGLPYEHMNSPVAQNRLMSEKEFLMLHRAIVDPGGHDKRAPLFAMATLRQAMTPAERMRLQSQWIAWQAQGAIELDELTEQKAVEIIEHIKKNGVRSVIKYGSHMLVTCLVFLDAQLSSLQSRNSSGGTS